MRHLGHAARLILWCAPRSQEVRPSLDKYYSVERTKELDAYLEVDANPKEKKAYLRTGTDTVAEFNIVSVTCAIGRQLLHEHSAARKGRVTRSSTTR